MEDTKTSTIQDLTYKLQKISQEGSTGTLICKSHQVEGEIHIISGKLMYMVAEKHRVRRWQRALTQFALHWKLETITISDNQPWEYQLLHHGIAHKQISLTQVKDIVRYVTEECLFELSGYTDLKFEWQKKDKTESGLALVLALSFEEIIRVINQVTVTRHDWDKGGLRVLSPTLAPVAKMDSDEKNLSIIEGFDGKLTLWDIALKQKKTITQLMSVVIPFVRKGVVKFREISDLSYPEFLKATPQLGAKIPPSTSAVANKSTESTVVKFGKGKALIACIDDSPVVAHNIKQILTPVGYDILSIPEPMHGFAQLIEHKPDLILLDINMPNANGYSVCQFLRNSPIFEKTPIIILTGQDTNIDRARAKLVGATDFIGKPAEKELLLSMIEKYLSK